MVKEFLYYYEGAKKMQELKFQGGSWSEADVNDDLLWNIPIYDVVNRRYAAFSSLPEAVRYGNNDPKGNGKHFEDVEVSDDDFVSMLYLFRLCGSGINYIPNTNGDFKGTHGFGNFWVVDELLNNNTDTDHWLEVIPENKFCDVKGYLLPMIKGGLRQFILDHSMNLVAEIKNFIGCEKKGITDVVDFGNKWLIDRGFKRQNFVLTAFAMDLAEYYPDFVDQYSDVYLGSNAKKCLKLIAPGQNQMKTLRSLCEQTGYVSKPYDMEDVACDFIRFIENFQSPDHIKANNGVVYSNNLKTISNV